MTSVAVAEREPSLRNISPFDELVIEIDDLYAEAKNWADGSPIETQAQCDALDVLDKSLLDASKRLDALRVEEKRPLDEQVQAIQDRYNPFIQPKKGKVDIARSALNPLRTAFKDAERRRKEAEAEAARKDAEEIRHKADEEMRASSGNLEARERAEEQLSLAKEAEKFAARKDKAATTGLGLRMRHVAKLTDLNAAIKHYWAMNRSHFEALVNELARRDVMAGVRQIPGFSVEEERVAL